MSKISVRDFDLNEDGDVEIIVRGSKKKPTKKKVHGNFDDGFREDRGTKKEKKFKRFDRD